MTQLPMAEDGRVACPLGLQCPHPAAAPTQAVVSPQMLPAGVAPGLPTTSPDLPSYGTLPEVNLQTTYRAAARTSFLRTLKVETRKLVDTRAALLLLTIGGGLALALIPAMALIMGFTTKAIMAGPPENRPAPETLANSFQSNVTGASSAIMLFLVIMAIMLATSEWTTRSALTTFSLEPRRGRVLAAKTLVATGLAVLVSLLALPLGAFAAWLADAVGGGGIDWSMHWGRYGMFVLASIMTTLFGMAWGLLTRSTTAGVIIYLVVPTVLELVAGLVQGLTHTGPISSDPTVVAAPNVWDKLFLWITPTKAGTQLQDGDFSGTTWAAYLVSQLIWVVLPFALGARRWMRSEAK